jgi:hypothetical protein
MKLRPRDNQRSRVYAFEGRIQAHEAPLAWETVGEVAAWLKPIWRAERGRYGRAKVPMPDVVPASWGQRSALAMPDHRLKLPRWARVPAVVLHEAAHRLTPRDEAHGPRFVGVLIGLLCRHAGHDANELMALADEMGVRYHVRSIGVVPVIGTAERIRRAIFAEGPMTEMDIACWLDLSYLQARGGALALIRQGKARWLRRKLTLTAKAPAEAEKPAPRQPRPDSTQAVAARFGISIERQGRSGYMVYPPEGIDDPFEGSHRCDDWAAVRFMVGQYAAAADKCNAACVVSLVALQ